MGGMGVDLFFVPSAFLIGLQVPALQARSVASAFRRLLPARGGTAPPIGGTAGFAVGGAFIHAWRVESKVLPS
jgi:hypothetical protein